MKENGAMEIISFEVMEAFTDEQVLRGLKALGSFYSQFSEVQCMRIAKNGTEIKLVITYDSLEDERRISSSMMKSKDTDGFKRIVNPQTVKKSVHPYFILENDGADEKK